MKPPFFKTCLVCGGQIVPPDISGEVTIGPGWHLCVCVAPGPRAPTEPGEPGEPPRYDLRDRLEMAMNYGMMLATLKCIRSRVSHPVRQEIDDLLWKVNPYRHGQKDWI